MSRRVHLIKPLLLGDVPHPAVAEAGKVCLATSRAPRWLTGLVAIDVSVLTHRSVVARSRVGGLLTGFHHVVHDIELDVGIWPRRVAKAARFMDQEPLR